MPKRKACSGVKSITVYFQRNESTEQPRSSETEQPKSSEVEQRKPSETEQPKPGSSRSTEAATPAVSIRDESHELPDELPEPDDWPLPQAQKQFDLTSFDDDECSADDNNLKTDVDFGPSSSSKAKNNKKQFKNSAFLGSHN